MNTHTDQLKKTYDDFLHRDGEKAMTGKLTAAASNSSRASINIPPGTAPSSPVNGDMWTETNAVKARINGTTREFYHPGNAATAALATVTQAEAEAGESTALRAWTPQRVRQAALKAVSSGSVAASMTGFKIPSSYYFAHNGYFWSEWKRYNIATGAETSFAHSYTGSIIVQCGIDGKAYIITLQNGILRAYSHNGTSQTNLAELNTGNGYVTSGQNSYYGVLIASSCGVLNPTNKRIYLWLVKGESMSSQDLWYYDINSNSFIDTGTAFGGMLQTGGANSKIANNYGFVRRFTNVSHNPDMGVTFYTAELGRYNYNTYTYENLTTMLSVENQNTATNPAYANYGHYICPVSDENVIYLITLTSSSIGTITHTRGIYNLATNDVTFITNDVPLGNSSFAGGGDGFIVSSKGAAFKIL